jgi:hypothetical protein
MKRPFLTTYTGKRLDPLRLRPEDVDPLDIAHSLAHQCRYGGHCSYYSVAEHSVLLSLAVPVHDALAALVHDGPEAYVTDLPRWLKESRYLAGYRRIEARVWRAVAERFGLPLKLPAAVTELDDRIVENEARALFSPAALAAWAENPKRLRIPGVRISHWSPAAAEQQWLQRLYELTER